MKKDTDKTKAQLLAELEALRKESKARQDKLNASNQQLRASEERHRRLATVVTDSNDAVTVQDLDGTITEWNRGAERMYGWTADEALAMNIRNTVPEGWSEQA